MRSYHLVNLLTHAFVCIALVYLLHELNFGVPQIVLSSSIFAVHPVHVEVIAGVVSRADLLSGLFYVLALIAYIQGLKGRHDPSGVVGFTVAYCMWIVATLCKEVGFTVLAGFVLAEVFFSGSKQTFRMEAWYTFKLRRRAWLRIAFAFFAAFTFMYFRVRLHNEAPLYQWTVMENQFSLMPNTLSRLLSILNTHAVYAGLLVWPQQLSFDHGFATLPIIETLSDPQNVSWVLTYLLVGGLVCTCLLRRKRRALWGLGIALASFLPASNLLIFVGTEVAERLLYIPTLGLTVTMAALFDANRSFLLPVVDAWEVIERLFLDRTQQGKTESHTATERKPREKQRNNTVAMFVCAVLLALAARSRFRCEDWTSEVTLYKAGVATHPRSLKALNNYANILMNRKEPGDLIIAQQLLERAIKIAPMPPALHNLGLTHLAMEHQAEAVHYFWKSLANLDTAPCTCFIDLAEIYLKDAMDVKGQVAVETSPELRGMEPVEAEQFWNSSKHQHIDLGQTGGRRSLNLAKALTERASACSAPTFKLSMLRTHMTAELGFTVNAIAEAERTFALASTAADLVRISSLAGLLYSKAVVPAKAKKYLYQALQLDGKNPAHVTNYANYLGSIGELAEAEALQRQALALCTTDSQRKAVLNNLADALYMRGKFQDIIEIAGKFPHLMTTAAAAGRVESAKASAALVQEVEGRIESFKSKTT